MHRIQKAVLLWLLIMVSALSGCAAPVKQRYQAVNTALFDTVTTVLGYEPDEQTFRDRADMVFSELETYDRLYDIYHEYPGLINLCTINSHPGEEFQVDQKIIDLLLLAKEADQFSGHRTDAMFGAVLQLWHGKREWGMEHPDEAVLPNEGELQDKAEHTGFQFLEINPERKTVRLTDPQASLDVGALAKGFATQRVCEMLPEGYLISAGGNVSATGPKPDGSVWTVGIQDPDGNGSEYLYKVGIARGSVVTSGDYQRYYTVDGVQFHHIIDPETLYPGRNWRSVSIIAEDSGLGDALSTSLFLMNLEEGQRLIESLGAEAMWIAPDGTEYFSPGFKDYIIP